MKQIKKKVNSNLITTWWFPVFVAVIVVVGIPVVIIPKISQIASAHQELSNLEKKLEKAEKKVAQLNEIDESEVSDLHISFRQALPAQKPYYEVLLLLQQLASKTGVVLGDFELNPGSLASDSAKTETKTSAEKYVKLDTELKLTGTSEQISQFVEALHESLPLLIVNSLTIGKNSAKETEDSRSVSVNVQILYKLDATANLSAEVNVEPLTPLSGSVKEVSQALSQYSNPNNSASTAAEPLENFARQDIFNY